MFGPLPEGSADPMLARMLEPVPYQAPSGEDKGGNKEAESRPRSLFIQTGGISASAKEDNQGEEPEIPSPQGMKRTTSEDPETKVSKRGEEIFARGSCLGGYSSRTVPARGSTLYRAVSKQKVLNSKNILHYF